MQRSRPSRRQSPFSTPRKSSTAPGGFSTTSPACSTVCTLRGEPDRRAQNATLTAEKRAEDLRRFEELLVVDWMRPPPPDPEPKPVPPPVARQPPLAPVRLVLVDEADRLRVSSLEQLRNLFDRNPIGLVLIGMPGMDKRLARYPQLYSRVGFVHAFRPLRANEIRQLLAAHCHEMGLDLPADGVSDPDCIAAIIRITAGNFRLIRRMLSKRILRVNGLSAVTPAVIDAAREGWVIGAA
jgi:AAA domain